jgi:hypothetical protein
VGFYRGKSTVPQVFAAWLLEREEHRAPSVCGLAAREGRAPYPKCSRSGCSNKLSMVVLSPRSIRIICTVGSLPSVHAAAAWRHQ